MPDRIIHTIVALLLFVSAGHSATIGGTNSVNVSIPNPGPYAFSGITFASAPEGAIVTGIDVYFRCIHSYSGDLAVELRADPEGALGIRTLWNREGGSANNPMRTVSGISTFNGLSVNRTWRLAARDFVFGDEGYIDEWTLTIRYTAPEPPGGFALSADAALCDRTNAPMPAVRLTWTAAPGDLVSYQVFRNDIPLGSASQNLTFYDNTGLTAGQPYRYHVQASNAGGSTNSAPVDVSIPNDVCGTPPGNFTLSYDAPLCDGGAPAVQLHWTAAVGVGIAYQVFRNSNPVGPITTGLTYYDDIGLTAGQTYNYAVRATNAGGVTFSTTVNVPIPVDLCWPPTNTTRALGINVSAQQAVIDWGRVATAGKTFAIIKASDGRPSQTGGMFLDARFATNMNGATQAGLLAAPFHFARPHTNAAIDEARHFLGVAGNYIAPGYLPPALGIDDPADEPPEVVSALGKEFISQWVREWCAEIQRVTGVMPVLYTTVSFAQNYMEPDLAQYPLWIAFYTIPPAAPMSPNANPSNLGPWGTSWSFMQYATMGTSVDGVPSSPVALNVFNGDTNALHQFVIPIITLAGVDGGPLRPPSGGNFQFSVHAPTLPQITVQASEDGTNWSDLGPATIVNGKTLFSDPNASAHAIRLYRSKP